MDRISSLALGLICLIGCAPMAGTPAAATEPRPPTVFVMGEDADADTIQRDNRVFRRVLQSMQERMRLGGYDVRDETALTIGNKQGRVRRTDEELILVAQRADVPIDVVAVFAIYVSTLKSDFDLRGRVTIEGRLLDPHGGRALGNFTLAPDEFKLPYECSSECLLDRIGDRSRTLGADLGDTLVKKLDQNWVRNDQVATDGGGAVAFPHQYRLVFEGFTNDEVVDIVEPYLKAFPGTRDYRLLESRPTYAAYALETTSEPERLQRNLTRMIQLSGLGANLIKEQGANNFVLQRLPELRKAPAPDPSQFE
ncbi:MAG: hypothetical protein WAS21_29425 [Geminicoccaceae bacterium]